MCSIITESGMVYHFCYGLFPLPDSDSDSDSDTDSKPYGYIILCWTCFHWLRLGFGSLSQMGTVPILGTDLSLYYIHFNQVSESKSKPMKKYCTVQKSVSEPESKSGNGNKPLDNWGRNVRTHVTWLKRDNLPTDPSLARALASASVTSILTPDLGVNSGTTTLATISLTAARLRFCLMPYISARRLAAANT